MRVPIFKRIFDIACALAGLVLLSGLLLLLAGLVRVFHGAPILFEQTRPGYKGRLFRIYKFRTMNNARAADGSLLPDAERLTPLGRFLRAASLDELPELFNILRGEMSLVGRVRCWCSISRATRPNKCAATMSCPVLPAGASGAWPQRPQLGREICAGCLVCGSLVFLARSKNSGA